MLIYSNNGYHQPYRAAPGGYKSVSKSKRRSIPAKAAKRYTQPPTRKAKKSKSSGKKRQVKSLNAKNVKFLKSLGFQVK